MKRTLYIDREFRSPYAMSAFVSLRVKQLDFTLDRVDINVGEQFRDGYTALSVTSRVPTLVEDDFALSESTAISGYLDEAYAGQLLYPADTKLRARARQIQAWLRSDLLALRDERNTGVIFKGERYPPLSSAGLAAAGKLIRAAEFWLGKGGTSLFGQWTIADVDLALMLHRLICHDEFIPSGLRSYAVAQWKHPAVQEWVSASQQVDR